MLGRISVTWPAFGDPAGPRERTLRTCAGEERNEPGWNREGKRSVVQKVGGDPRERWMRDRGRHSAALWEREKARERRSRTVRGSVPRGSSRSRASARLHVAVSLRCLLLQPRLIS